MLQKQWRLRELNFSCALGFLKIILEGEALQTVQALEKVGVIGAFMAILSRRHGGVLNNLQNCKIHHVRQNLNSAAH
jgi:hypothetical protein